MKLLLFAHVPPPYHGQSYEVERLLNGFGGNHRQHARRADEGPANAFGIECYHVNARFSKTLEDVGEFQGAKIFLIFFYCLQAVWCRFRYGVENFYYVPAPGKTRRALPRLAGDAHLPPVFQTHHPALARRRAGQMAGNHRVHPHAQLHLPTGCGTRT